MVLLLNWEMIVEAKKVEFARVVAAVVVDLMFWMQVLLHCRKG